MISEPYKIKEVKKFRTLKHYEKWNVLRDASFNTFHICSDFVNFDLVSRGMSAWSHFQKAAYMTGDEAYSGSQNFLDLARTVNDVLGIDGIVPAHNGIGAEKLLVTCLLKRGQTILHNRGVSCELVSSLGCDSIDITNAREPRPNDPQSFGADVDLDQLQELIEKSDGNDIAYVHIETCPKGSNESFISWDNLVSIREITEKNDVPLGVPVTKLQKVSVATCFRINSLSGPFFLSS